MGAPPTDISLSFGLSRPGDRRSPACSEQTDVPLHTPLSLLLAVGCVILKGKLIAFGAALDRHVGTETRCKLASLLRMPRYRLTETSHRCSAFLIDVRSTGHCFCWKGQYISSSLLGNPLGALQHIECSYNAATVKQNTDVTFCLCMLVDNPLHLHLSTF